NGMGARKSGRRVLRSLARAYQWTISGVGADDVFLTEIDRKIAVEMIHQIRYIFPGGQRTAEITRSAVGRAEEYPRLPGDEKEQAAVVSLRQNDRIIADLHVLTRENQMNALARLDMRLRAFPQQRLHLFREDAGRVNDMPGAYRHRPPGEMIAYMRSLNFAVLDKERGDLCVVCNDRPALCCRAN